MHWPCIWSKNIFSTSLKCKNNVSSSHPVSVSKLAFLFTFLRITAVVIWVGIIAVSEFGSYYSAYSFSSILVMLVVCEVYLPCGFFYLLSAYILLCLVSFFWTFPRLISVFCIYHFPFFPSIPFWFFLFVIPYCYAVCFNLLIQVIVVVFVSDMFVICFLLYIYPFT